MPALQVRDFPQELYDELRDFAARNHRSIAQQTIACVENDIRRSRERATQGSADFADVPVPPAMHGAAMQARAVDAFGWANAFRAESPEQLEERRARREALRGQLAALAGCWKGQPPSCEEVARAVREGREDRADQIAMNVEQFLEAKGRA
jgi:hypothetical protein